MPSSKPTLGVNDLQSQFPEIAAEAYGWDPENVFVKSGKKLDWKCSSGHIYSSVVNARTGKGSGCAVCSGQQVLAGFNDLKTKFPDIAAEAYEWDPTTVTAATHQRKDWECNQGHIYSSVVSSRTGGSGCPFCSGRQSIKGENDLKTKFPDIAAEAFGWDPEMVTAGSNKKKDWKCNQGHIYSSVVFSRTGGSGCPICCGQQVVAGFNDLKTKFPDIAAEAFGWDPETVTGSSGKKKEWKCNQGHIYSCLVGNRTGRGNGCPICSGRQVLAGFNDLQTKFPDIAADAYEWDPTTVASKTAQKKKWKCNKGHFYSSTVISRTSGGTRCAVCSGHQVLAGFNDLQTKFPDIAAEAYGWDPETVTGASNKKKDWKCNKGHIYFASVGNRTNGKGCPVCSGQQVLAGFNDLKTKFPDIAAEAYEWDPETVTGSSGKKKEWKCKEGHIYPAVVANRTKQGSDCPTCAESGFNPEKDAWFYLMQRPGEQQLGISNVITDRLRTHESNGWNLIEHTSVPSSGQKVLDTEKAFKK